MNHDLLRIYSWDWGVPYIDSYNLNTRNAILVFNFNYINSNLDDICQYSLSHVVWCFCHISKGSSVTIIFDIRGQVNVDSDVRIVESKLRLSIYQVLGKVRFNVIINR